MLPAVFRSRSLSWIAPLVLLAGCATGPLADYYALNPFRRQGPEEEQYGPAPAVLRERTATTRSQGAANAGGPAGSGGRRIVGADAE